MQSQSTIAMAMHAKTALRALANSNPAFLSCLLLDGSGHSNSNIASSVNFN
jgi:hypothetical protein